MTVGAQSINLPAFAAFGLLAVVYVILGTAAIGGTASYVANLTKIGGWVALADGVAAWYLGTGILLNGMLGRELIPPLPVPASCVDGLRGIRLLAAATRGYPKVGDEGFPGNQIYNDQIKTLLKQGAHVYACRFSAAALYGMREIDMMEGVKPIGPRVVLDAAITAWRENALVINTWTV